MKDLPAMDYQTAVERLRSPRTRDQAARALAALGEPRALPDLMNAYELGLEMSALALLDAMQALGGADGADEWYDAAGEDQRRKSVHMMELFPADSHLPRLRLALGDADPRVRTQARRSLSTQRQTPDWESLLVELLAAPGAADRLQAAESLAARRGPSVREALRARLPLETDPTVRAALERALRDTP